MPPSTTFSLRPLGKGEWKGTLEGAFRLHLNLKDMAALELQPGDFCYISKTDGVPGLAITWPSPDPKLSQRIIRVSDTLRDLYQLSLDDRVEIRKSDDTRVPASIVHVSAVDQVPLSEGFKHIEALSFAINLALGKASILSVRVN
jgi:hypothetical protein